jgi:hypothetical protein
VPLLEVRRGQITVSLSRAAFRRMHHGGNTPRVALARHAPSIQGPPGGHRYLQPGACCS